MDPVLKIETEAVAPEAPAEVAPEASSPDVTIGPDSSSGTPDKSTAEKVRDAFIAEFGDGTERSQEAPPEEPVKEPEDVPGAREGTEPSEEDKFRLSEAEFATLKELAPKVQQRIGQLSGDRRKLKQEVETLTSQVTMYEADHTALEQLRQFTVDAGLEPDDVTAGMGALRAFSKAGMTRDEVFAGQKAMLDFKLGNFKEFRDVIKPLLETAELALGERVTPEIQALVESGEITEAQALRMSKAEQSAAIVAQRLEKLAAVQAAAQQQTATRQHVITIRQAVADTEKVLSETDADYAKKEPAIRQQLQLMLKYGAIPRTPEAAVEMVKAVHGSVVAPRPEQPTSTQPRPAATSGPRRAAPPRTTLESVLQAAQTMPGAA